MIIRFDRSFYTRVIRLYIFVFSFGFAQRQKRIYHLKIYDDLRNCKSYIILSPV